MSIASDVEDDTHSMADNFLVLNPLKTLKWSRWGTNLMGRVFGEKERSSHWFIQENSKKEKYGLPLLSIATLENLKLANIWVTLCIADFLAFSRILGKMKISAQLHNNHRVHRRYTQVSRRTPPWAHIPQKSECVCVHRCAIFAKLYCIYFFVATSTPWLSSEHIINYSKIRSKSFRCTQPSLQRSCLLCNALSHSHPNSVWVSLERLEVE